MWRSPVSVHGWGPCGRRFKSCHPDKQTPNFFEVGCFFWVCTQLYCCEKTKKTSTCASKSHPFATNECDVKRFSKSCHTDKQMPHFTEVGCACVCVCVCVCVCLKRGNNKKLRTTEGLTQKQSLPKKSLKINFEAFFNFFKQKSTMLLHAWSALPVNWQPCSCE
jgi:hypothetical protein